MHGGTVEARSDGPGHGQRVRRPPAGLRRPAAERRPAGRGGRAGGRRPPAARVLVVDDNVDAAESLALLLRLCGPRGPRGPRRAGRPLEAAAEFRPDVVLLDIGLPGMDGYEVARRLRRTPRPAAAVLVALTGWGQEEDRRRSREAGFDHHLVKPVDPDALNRVLADLRLGPAAAP